MAEILLTIFFISVLLFFLGSGIWVALSMIGVSAVGMMLFTSRPVGDAMATTIWGTSSSWTLTALPLFVWMGEILFRTRLSENLFKGLSPWMQNLPGGLIHVNVVGCALFAAISGSSAATVATVGKMSIPELRKRNYPEKILLGSLAGSGTLGLLIPPSIILIIYGVAVQESIAKLFIAGIIPGIMIALIFMSYVIIWSLINKKDMPKIIEQYSFLEKVKKKLPQYEINNPENPIEISQDNNLMQFSLKAEPILHKFKCSYRYVPYTFVEFVERKNGRRGFEAKNAKGIF